MAMRDTAMDQAQSHFMAARDLLSGRYDNSSRKMLSRVYASMGKLATQQGDRSQAFSAYRQSYEAARQQNSQAAMHHALQRIAALYLDINQPKKAMAVLSRTLAT
jgi:hypothetical protein